jgi:putative hydrolase of the HAD superfamily
MIRVVCFDLDGVYFIKGKKNFITNLVKLGVPEKKAIEVFFKSDRMNNEYKTGLISDKEFWTWALKEWRLKMAPKEIIDLMISGYEVNQPAANLVERLRVNGYKTAICSNNFPARVKGLDKRFHFLANFNVVVFSYEVGVLKPDKGIFEELIKKSQVKPEEIAYSDDDETKIKGATELGIETFIYQNFNQFYRELKKLGVRLG